MGDRMRHHVRHNVVAYVALFFALTGTAGAAGVISGQLLEDGSVGAAKTNATIQDRSVADALTCPGGTFLQAVAPSGAPTCEAVVDDSGSVRSTYGRPGEHAVFLEIDGVRVIGTCGNTLAGLQFGTLGGPARIVDQTSDLVETLPAGQSVLLGTAAPGESAHTVLHVAYGPDFSKHATFIATVARGQGCPAEFWGTALTGG